MKLLYERELEDAKKLIEELAREKSRVEIDAVKSEAEAQNALARLGRKERDHRAAESRLKQYEGEMAELKARNEALVYDNNRKADDLVVRRTFEEQNSSRSFLRSFLRGYTATSTIWRNK